MQPTFLPWSGYFNLIASVDRFVFLDDVQFRRQSWQSRNRILLNGNEHMLVVPVERRPKSTLLKDAPISRALDWRRKHWLTLSSAYAKAAYGHEALALLKPFFEDDVEHSLHKFNEDIIRAIADALRLQTPFLRASSLNAQGKRSERLANICRAVGCDSYLSPCGAKEYLEKDKFSQYSDIQLQFQNFNPSRYTQFRSADFVSHLSIIDVIANLGLQGAKAYISGQAP